MADLGTLVTITDKVFQLLQSQVIKDWKSNLNNLQKSVPYIKGVLVDMDTKLELSREEQTWVEELKEVLYEADDLFDKVNTIDKMKELDEDEVDTFLKKVLDMVSRFFSSKNPILVSYYHSQEVQGIHQKLDAIASNRDKYNFKVDSESLKSELKYNHQATLKRRTDTSSVLDENIIGREDDMNTILDMLMDPNFEGNVGFVVIVGIGGLGKTTLAQLVYNHDRVRTMFEKKLWVCVSDQDGKGLNVKAILGNIIESSTTKKPSDVSTMQTMQTKFQECLVMRDCRRFHEWPNCFCKLVNLRLLDIRGCGKLTRMPIGINQLINLRDLTSFEVGGVSLDEKQSGGELKDLKSLINLRGEIYINIHGNLASMNENVCEDGYLKHIENLKAVTIGIPAEAFVINQEALIAKLQPNQNLTKLSLYNYNGTEIPRWGRAHDDWARIFPDLVKIELKWCMRLQGIPLLSNLKHLKVLSLQTLTRLEYMEPIAVTHGCSGLKDVPFFPSLEYLSMWGLERLIGWRGGVGESDGSNTKSHWPSPFPRLSTLIIDSCPNLTSFPPCPRLESLEVRRSKIFLGMLPDERHGNLDIKNSPSLQSIEIARCTRLTSILRGLEYLTALESLLLEDSYAEVNFDDMPWRSLSRNLRTLKLKFFRIRQNLPTGMKHLTALQVLYISNCKPLKVLPEWISSLSSLRSVVISSCPGLESLGLIQNITSLQKLDIKHCPKLTEACRKPNGKEWPNVRHIPQFSISIYKW
ncbi:hypothetical protein KSS87_012602 [Heliosperma pusillum]|nr:hypothetical protein KSS87_012602 [Heliosperma pusillum]